MEEDKAVDFVRNFLKVGSGVFAGIPLITYLRANNVPDLWFSVIQCIFFTMYYTILDMIFRKIMRSKNQIVLDLSKEKGNINIESFEVDIDENGNIVLSKIKKPFSIEISARNKIYKKYLNQHSAGIDIFDPSEIPQDCDMYIYFSIDDLYKIVRVKSRKICKLDKIDPIKLAEFIRPFDKIENKTELPLIVKEITGRNVNDLVEYIEWEDLDDDDDEEGEYNE